MLIIAQVLKEKWLENDCFCSITNNKQFRQVSGQDRKIPLALGTNQIAGFGGFRPPASLEKITLLIPLIQEFRRKLVSVIIQFSILESFFISHYIRDLHKCA